MKIRSGESKEVLTPYYDMESFEEQPILVRKYSKSSMITIIALLFVLLVASVYGLFVLNSRIDNAINRLSSLNPELAHYGSQLTLQFDTFMQRFNKVYATSEEKGQAMEHYSINLLKLQEWRALHPLTIFDEHEWMDQTEENIKQKFGLMQSFFPSSMNMSRLKQLTRFADEVGRPDSFSLQDKAGPVKNQRDCGSCWAFSVVSTVEIALAKKEDSVRLSEQELVDCDHSNHGCHGGNTVNAMSFVLGNGLLEESEYPYTARDGSCRGNELQRKRTIDSAYSLQAKNEGFMADWIYEKGPLSIILTLPDSFQSYRGGVYHPSPAECNTQAYHAMTIVGYGVQDNQDYWLVRNSWGSGWGDGGYIKFARGSNVCGLAEYPVGPIA